MRGRLFRRRGIQAIERKEARVTEKAFMQKPHLKLALRTPGLKQPFLELTNAFLLFSERNVSPVNILGFLIAPLHTNGSGNNLTFFLLNDSSGSAEEVEVHLSVADALNCFPSPILNPFGQIGWLKDINPANNLI